MAFRKLRSDANSITYADPTNPDLTVRCKQGSATKSLGGVPVVNNVTEIIINDFSDITVGSETLPEALSVRAKISGSHFSQTQKVALAGLLADLLDQWAAEDVLDGFEPVSVPVLPV